MMIQDRNLLVSIVCAASFATAPVRADGSLVEARKAAIDGDHARCVTLAEKARRASPETWHAHQVYASCAAIDAQKNKNTLGPAKYEAQMMSAIEAMELLATGDLIPTARQKLQFSNMAIEMRKRLTDDLAHWKKDGE